MHDLVKKARIKGFAMMLGFGIIAALVIYFISDSMGCDSIKIDTTNSTSVQSSKQYQQVCYSMSSNGKMFSFVLPLIGFAFWFIIDKKVRQVSNEIDQALQKQDGKCFNCAKNILNDLDATLEKNDHCYCKRCDDLLFPTENSN